LSGSHEVFESESQRQNPSFFPSGDPFEVIPSVSATLGPATVNRWPCGLWLVHNRLTDYWWPSRLLIDR